MGVIAALMALLLLVGACSAEDEEPAADSAADTAGGAESEADEPVDDDADSDGEDGVPGCRVFDVDAFGGTLDDLVPGATRAVVYDSFVVNGDGHPVWAIAFAPDVIVLLHNSSGTPPEDNSGLWSSLDSASNAASQFPILAGGLDDAIDVNEMIVHGADCLEQTG